MKLKIILYHARTHQSTTVYHFQSLVRFAHAETLVPLIGLFGLFRDGDHLTVDRYNGKRMSNRKVSCCNYMYMYMLSFAEHTERTFRVSRFASFSSNIVFVLYQCVKGIMHTVFHMVVTPRPLLGRI